MVMTVKKNPMGTIEREHQQRGAITVFLAILFLSFVILTGVLVDGARMRSAGSYTSMAMDTALLSTLAGYDSQLKEEYGVFALDTSNQSTIQEQLRFHLHLNLVPRDEDDGTGGLDLYRFRIEEVAPLLDEHTLYDNAVLRHQILEHMKYRAPVSVADNYFELMWETSQVVESHLLLNGLYQVGKYMELLSQEMKTQQDALEAVNAFQSSNTEALIRDFINCVIDAGSCDGLYNVIMADIEAAEEAIVEGRNQVSIVKAYRDAAFQSMDTLDSGLSGGESTWVAEVSNSVSPALASDRQLLESDVSDAVLDNIIAGLEDNWAALGRMKQEMNQQLGAGEFASADPSITLLWNDYQVIEWNYTKASDHTTPQGSPVTPASREEVDQFLSAAQGMIALISGEISGTMGGADAPANWPSQRKPSQEFIALQGSPQPPQQTGGLGKNTLGNHGAATLLGGLLMLALAPLSLATARWQARPRGKRLVAGLLLVALVLTSCRPGQPGIPGEDPAPGEDMDEEIEVTEPLPGMPEAGDQDVFIPLYGEDEGYTLSEDMLRLLLPGEDLTSFLVVLQASGKLAQGMGDPAAMMEHQMQELYVNEYIMGVFAKAHGENTHLSGSTIPQGRYFDFEVEYCLGGSINEEDNQQQVMLDILSHRLVANLMHLHTDENKRRRVYSLAAAIAEDEQWETFDGAIGMTALQRAIELLWAGVETVADMTLLQEGRKVSLLKEAAGWQTPGSAMGSWGAVMSSAGMGGTDGWNYESHLRHQLLRMGFLSPSLKIHRIQDLLHVNSGKELENLHVMLGMNARVIMPYFFMSQPFMPESIEVPDALDGHQLQLQMYRSY